MEFFLNDVDTGRIIHGKLEIRVEDMKGLVKILVMREAFRGRFLGLLGVPYPSLY